MTNVIKLASIVTLHFFDFRQLNGFRSFLGLLHSVGLSLSVSLGDGFSNAGEWFAIIVASEEARVGVVQPELCCASLNSDTSDEQQFLIVKSMAEFCRLRSNRPDVSLRSQRGNKCNW